MCVSVCAFVLVLVIVVVELLYSNRKVIDEDAHRAALGRPIRPRAPREAAWRAAPYEATTPTEKALPQEVKIRELQTFLRLVKDPDAGVLRLYDTGVRVGYELKMPRGPAVFEQNGK